MAQEGGWLKQFANCDNKRNMRLAASSRGLLRALAASPSVFSTSCFSLRTAPVGCPASSRRSPVGLCRTWTRQFIFLSKKDKEWLGSPSQHAPDTGAISRQLRLQDGRRFLSGEGEEVQLAFALEDSKVVTNVLKGEKLSVVSYERKKETEVLFIDEESGTKTNMQLKDVVRMAVEKKLDPVMVAPDAEVPVMKLMDYRKVRHQMLKKAKEHSKTASTLALKEVRLGLNVGKSDLDRLLKQASEFLEKGHRVKLFMRLKGKDFYTNQDKASELLLQMASSLSEVGTVENPAELVGRSTNIFLSPMKKGKGKDKSAKKDKKEASASTKDGKD